MLAPRLPQDDRGGLPAGGSFVYERSSHSAPATGRVNVAGGAREAWTARQKSPRRDSDQVKSASAHRTEPPLTCRPGTAAIPEDLKFLSRMNEPSKSRRHHGTIAGPLVSRHAFPLLAAG